MAVAVELADEPDGMGNNLYYVDVSLTMSEGEADSLARWLRGRGWFAESEDMQLGVAASKIEAGRVEQ